MSLSAQFVKNLQRFRLVTFDVTDTLLCLKDPSIQYAATAAAHGVQNLDKERIRECFRQQFKIMERAHPNFGRHTPEMEWQEWWTQLVCNVFKCVEPNLNNNRNNGQQLQQIAKELVRIYRTSACWAHIPCGSEFVQDVRSAVKTVGVISNFDPSLSTVLHEMNLLDKFHFVLTSYEAGIGKPHGNIFSMPLKRYKIEAAEALHIGNKYSVDYIGARNCGWSSLLVQRTGEVIPKDIEATHVYDSLADMFNALHTTDIKW